MTTTRSPVAAGRGFTLIELLITLLVVSVGLLGLAKLEAAATAESQVSRTRALMTMQAESLASMMRANRAYWAAVGTPNVTVTSVAGAAAPTITGNPLTISVPTSTTKTCNAASTVTPAAPITKASPVCTSAAQVAYDDVVTNFAPTFDQQFPTGKAVIACSTTGTATNPSATNCKISMSWQERAAVAINRTANAATSTVASPITLVLYVQL